jgi:hypothetical protein
MTSVERGGNREVAMDLGTTPKRNINEQCPSGDTFLGTPSYVNIQLRATSYLFTVLPL